LSDTVLSKIARNRYEKAVCLYFEWLQDRGEELPADEKNLDESLCEYIESVWEDGGVKSLVSNLLSGLGSLCKSLKGQYKTAWSLYTAWGTLEMPERARPFTAEDAMAVAGFFLAKGLSELAILTLVGFHCLLRTNEMLTLRRISCEIAEDEQTCLLQLGYTKGGKRRGVAESVIVTDTCLVKALQVLCAKIRPGDFLCECSYQQYRKYLSDALIYLGLENLNFRTYSLRRGGASFHFVQTGSYSTTCQRGRWSSLKTCRMYIDESSQLARYKVSAKHRKRHLDLYNKIAALM